MRKTPIRHKPLLCKKNELTHVVLFVLVESVVDVELQLVVAELLVQVLVSHLEEKNEVGGFAVASPPQLKDVFFHSFLLCVGPNMTKTKTRVELHQEQLT